MSVPLLFIPILVPLVGAAFLFFIKKREWNIKSLIAFIICGFNLVFSILLLSSSGLKYEMPWGFFGLEFSLILFDLNSLMLLMTAICAFLVALYALAAFRHNDNNKRFFIHFLLILAFANGCLLADNLLVLLFFWSAIMWPLYFMILAGGQDKYPTGIKALIINVISDLCMMVGIALTSINAGTLALDNIYRMPLDGAWPVAGFMFLVIGAIAKAGAMPFHTWIPDASVDAPVSFVALVPAALQKILGVYFLLLACVSLYDFRPDTGLSTFIMILGVITLAGGVLLAAGQRDYKRILAYLCVSQVGYVILAIGTAQPIGVVGALFHTVNVTLCQCCLFMTAGAVEAQTGMISLDKLGGLGKQMPVTAVCFGIAAFSLIGVVPLSGFFSQEMIFNAALSAGLVYYLLALAGTFLTAMVLFRLWHSVFGGADRGYTVREAATPILLAMALPALASLVFGLGNGILLKGLIQPIFAYGVFAGKDLAGWPDNLLMALTTLVVIVLACTSHIYAVHKTGAPDRAADRLCQAPVLRYFYRWSATRVLDPYELLSRGNHFLAQPAWLLFRRIEVFSDAVSTRIEHIYASATRRLSASGDTGVTRCWLAAGLILVAVLIMACLGI